MSLQLNLNTVREVTIDFHGDSIVAVKKDGEVWVSIRRICECLGISLRRQQRKLESKAWATVAFMAVVAADGRKRDQFMLSLKSLPMWLATLEASRLSDAVRPKLASFQCECHEVLSTYFFSSQSEMPTRVGRKIRVDHVGEVYGNWTIVAPDPSSYGWIAECYCGCNRVVQIRGVLFGQYRCKQCGKKESVSPESHLYQFQGPNAQPLSNLAGPKPQPKSLPLTSHPVVAPVEIQKKLRELDAAIEHVEKLKRECKDLFSGQ